MDYQAINFSGSLAGDAREVYVDVRSDGQSKLSWSFTFNEKKGTLDDFYSKVNNMFSFSKLSFRQMSLCVYRFKRTFLMKAIFYHIFLEA